MNIYLTIFNEFIENVVLKCVRTEKADSLIQTEWRHLKKMLEEFPINLE